MLIQLCTSQLLASWSKAEATCDLFHQHFTLLLQNQIIPLMLPVLRAAILAVFPLTHWHVNHYALFCSGQWIKYSSSKARG